MTMTATRQRNAVSEGAALGFVALGYDRIPFDKVRVDLAFRGPGGTGRMAAGSAK
jgi:hypothetical protein